MDRLAKCLLSLGALICVLGATSVACAQVPVAPPSRSVEAEGCGTILGGDIARARDEAIIDARRRALEQASSVSARSISSIRTPS